MWNVNNFKPLYDEKQIFFFKYEPSLKLRYKFTIVFKFNIHIIKVLWKTIWNLNMSLKKYSTFLNNE